jgi:hypothetical protein
MNNLFTTGERMFDKFRGYKSGSSFWMDDDYFTKDKFDPFTGEEIIPEKRVDFIKLAAYRRTMANFVNIVTGDNIPVKFNSSNDSYTDGKTVTIAAKIDNKYNDSNVGLALHEGSHIKLSDFDLLKELYNTIPISIKEKITKKYFSHIDDQWTRDQEVKEHIHPRIKNILNYIEDRRIDFFIFTNSPGYRDYYKAMYNRYFYSRAIDKGLKSNEYREETWESYEFRLINLHNKNTDLKALNSLTDIYKLIDLKNISRLESTEDAVVIAIKVFLLIEKNITPTKMNKSGESDESTESEANKSLEDGSNRSNENGEGTTIDTGDAEMKADGEASDFVSDLTPAAKRGLENAIKKQKKFMNGEINKKKLSKKDATALNAIEESGASYENAGKGMNDWRNGGNGTDVIVIRDVTQKLIESNEFRMLSENRYYRDENEPAIADGIRLGTMLGKKLQVRNDEKSTKFNRLYTGKIDKRLIAELGFGNESVFHKMMVDRYSPAILHISIDASGSMGGDKWKNTMTSVVAIAKAASMISNLDVVISFRSTHEAGRGYRSSVSYPLIAIAYDSRKDKFSKIPRIFNNIHVSGTTPEGLTFEAIMKELVPGGIDKDSYFLNFSDGMPMFSNDTIYYTGDEAVKHTKKMTNKIRNMGVKVLSYYIGGEYERESNMIDFKTMYGKDACFINVTNVFEVAKTMNKLFLDK